MTSAMCGSSVIRLGALGAIALLTIASAPTARSQVVPSLDTPLPAWVAARSHAAPNTLPDFATPTERARVFGTMLQSLLERNWPQAATLARSISYRLVMVRDGTHTFIAASDESGTGRDPSIILNLDSRRDVIVGAPHMPFEPGTGEQAAIFLRDLAGRAAIISGAHRCASRSFTRCDGKTEVCGGGLQDYRSSDPGHNVETLYHLAHVVFASRWPNAVVISLHGMREDTEGVRTSIIISNGVRATDANLQTPATRLRQALGTTIAQSGLIVSCNFPGDATFKFRPLCGYTNVQGRYVNGGSDACRASGEQGAGRFIHIEQDWNVLGPYAERWGQIASHPYNRAYINALATILPPTRGP